MTLSLIVAMTDERVIGVNNTLPWHLSEDLKRFKTITLGHPIIMGRKTFESIGKPLPGRQNIVVTENRGYQASGIDVATSLEEAVSLADGESEEMFVIGGARLFEAALPLADKIYLTLIHKDFKGDVYFPQFDVEKDLKVIEQTDAVSPVPDPFPYSFITAEFKR